MSNTVTKSDISYFNEEQQRILKNMICKDASAAEISLFAEMSKSLDLSPFLKEIYFFKQGSSPIMGIGISGYRKIAERTGKYAPGKAVDYTYDRDGKVMSATAFVKKLTQDGTWHEVSATVFMDEFPKAAKSGMPRHKLGINAESHALRKAFPMAYNGLYSKEELETSNLEVDVEKEAIEVSVEDSSLLNEQQCAQIDNLLDGDMEYKKVLETFFKVESIYDLKPHLFDKLITALHKRKATKVA